LCQGHVLAKLIMNQPPSKSPGNLDETSNGSDSEHDSADIRLGLGKPLITIRGYRIVKWLGGGGQGEVYEAVQEVTGARVAVKVLKKSLCESQEAKSNLLHEIRLLAQLKHPNIVTIHDAGETEDGRLYFVMELLRCGTLREYVRDHVKGVPRILELMRAVASGVGFVHSKGVVHRDLKPTNILMDTHGTPKLVDFGLAKTLIAPDEFSDEMRLGTLPYMSPEQTRGNPDEVDARTDVYALGVMLYELLTGDYPYPITGSILSVFKRIRESSPTPLRRMWTLGKGIASRAAPDGGRCPIDRRLESLVLRALEKEPGLRLRDANSLSQNLELYLRDQPLAPPLPFDPVVTAGRRFLLNHPVLSFLVFGFLAFAAAEALAEYWIFPRTNLHPAYGRSMSHWFSSTSPRPLLEKTRIIGLRDDTDLKALARTVGLDERSVDMPGGLRPLFGRMMERLAGAGCGVLAWDFEFRGDQPEFDPAFVRGVQAIRQAGTDVLIGASGWWLAESQAPHLSSAIKDAVTGQGSVVVEFNASRPWTVPLAAKRDIQPPVGQLVLLAFSAYHHRGKNPRIVFDESQQEQGVLELRYETRDAAGREWVRARMQIRLTDTYVVGPRPWDEEVQVGLQPGDRLANITIQLPEDAQLAEATVGLDQVFKASADELRERFQNNVVFVGDLRSGSHDVRGHPNGRRVPGCLGLAAAVDQLLRLEGTFQLGPTGEALLSALGAWLGALTALLAFGRPQRRLLVLGAWTLVFLLASVLVYRLYQYLWNPIAATIAMWLAAESYAAARRFAGIDRSRPHFRSLPG